MFDFLICNCHFSNSMFSIWISICLDDFLSFMNNNKKDTSQPHLYTSTTGKHYYFSSGYMHFIRPSDPCWSMKPLKPPYGVWRRHCDLEQRRWDVAFLNAIMGYLHGGHEGSHWEMVRLNLPWFKIIYPPEHHESEDVAILRCFLIDKFEIRKINDFRKRHNVVVKFLLCLRYRRRIVFIEDVAIRITNFLICFWKQNDSQKVVE